MLWLVRHLSPNMRQYLKALFLLIFCLAAGAQPAARAAVSERRFALVVGNASYEAGRLATAINDAELIARTLQAAGFEVVHAHDLKQGAQRQVFNDFFELLRKAGPDSIALVYFAGYGLQVGGENYLLPVDARIAVASDVPRYGFRVSELMQALSALRSKPAITILDAARKSPFVIDGMPPAAGLAWLEPEANSLVAFNASPGMVSPDAMNDYAPYARAIAEMINEPGLALAEIFVRARLRVHDLTKGAQLPWHAANFESPLVLVERPFGKVQRARSLEREAWLRSQPMGGLGSQDAYFAALIRDTFDAYTDFLADHGRDPLAKRVEAILATRREAITWRRTCQANVPEAYWTYLDRYPNGAHRPDAKRSLERFKVSIVPPPKFERVEYDIPPPLPNEQEYVGPSPLSLAQSAFLPEPGPGPHDLFEDPPEFPVRPEVAPSVADAVPATPSQARRGGDSSSDFDTTQLKPSIDDHAVKADLPSARPSVVAAEGHRIGELDDNRIASGVSSRRGGSGPIKLPSWANLDPPRAATAADGAGHIPEPIPMELPAWANAKLVSPGRIVPSAGEPLWTGALESGAHALPRPTGLALRGRRWVLLTPEATLPLPVARPRKLSPPLLFNRAKSYEPTPSAFRTTRQTVSPGTSAGSAKPPQVAARTAASNPHSSSPAISKPATARAGSPADTSSAVTIRTTRQTVSPGTPAGSAKPHQVAARTAASNPRSSSAAISKPATARAGSPAGTSSAVTTDSR